MEIIATNVHPQVNNFKRSGGENFMSNELDEAQERGRITTIGFAHIRSSLGYDEGKLSLETSEGMSLAYQMGILVCMGIEGDELMTQEQKLLSDSRKLIAHNSFVKRNQYGP